MAGWGDQDDDLGDLLPAPTMTSSTYGFAKPDEEEDLSANPFAEMASSGSAAVYTPPPFKSYEPQSPERSTLPPDTPSSYDEPRGFTRESAPEPETPAFARTASTSAYDYRAPSSPTSPFQAPYSPPAPSEQTPFGSPPVSPSTTRASAWSPTLHARPAAKPDLSALLGEEKPILPKFAKREAPEGVAGPLGSKIAVLPVSSIGKKPVGGALATLLGLEVEENELEKEKAREAAKLKAKMDPEMKETTTTSPPVPATAPTAPASASSAEEEESSPSLGDASAPPAPEPEVAEPTSAEVLSSLGSAEALPPSAIDVEPIPPPVLVALSTPLPPSPSVSPPPPNDSAALTPQAPSLSRESSRAASMLSVDSETNGAYDTIVSPMEPEVAGEAWPGEDKQGSVEGLEKKLEALQVDTTARSSDGDTSMANSEPTPTEENGEVLPVVSTPTPSTPLRAESADLAANTADPFAQYTYASDAPSSATSRPSLFDSQASPTANRGLRSYNGSTDEAGFGAGEDTDSLRGTYSRSVAVSEGGEDANESTEVGVTSPPLPPLPTMGSPSIAQTSPRSTEIGGSLGPTFIISVGDPQKIGSSLNVAAQHTVYTVRTRTTSKAFRKNDFAVLRRFSHFLWLFDALTLNNPGVIVPGMPEKSALGRFGSDFVENRRSGLQAALMKIVSHPMLVGDPDLRLFLESDTFAIDIKQRKLDGPAESKGLFASISGVISGPSFVEFDEYFDTRRQVLESFEAQLRSLLTSLSAAAKVRHSLQASIAELQSAFLGLAQCDLSPTLRKVLEDAAKVQDRLRYLSEQQSQSEDQIGGLNSVAEGYARLCASARLVFGARIKAYHVWQSAESNLRKTKAAHDKAKKSGRTHSELLGLAVSEIADAERKMLDAKQDFEDVSKLTKAEMARFDKEKVDDFKKAIEDYADGMVKRQREVVSTWQMYHDMLVNVVAANTQPSSAPAQPISQSQA